MSNDPFTFGPEERGFMRVSDDDSDALYATNESRDATGNVARVEFAARGSESAGFYAQKVQRNEAGEIVGKETFGGRKDTRSEAIEGVESMVRNRTAANFGGFEIGEFNVGDDSDIGLARRAHLSRSQEAQASDAAKRAPVTTNASRYASQPGELDYPGVDTPSTDPNVLPKDLRQQQRPATTDPPEPTTTQSRPSSMPMVMDESAAGFSDEYGTVGQELRSTAASRAPEPVNVGGEAADSMIADGMGGVALDRNTGGYRETDRPEKDETPPDIARGEDPFDMTDDGGALSDQNASEDSERREKNTQEYEFSKETLAFGKTFLNEEVGFEGRDQLEPLRQKVSSGIYETGGSVELTPGEFKDFQRVVRDNANEQLDTLEEKEATIMGDAERQRKRARQARQEIFNTAPDFGGG